MYWFDLFPVFVYCQHLLSQQTLCEGGYADVVRSIHYHYLDTMIYLRNSKDSHDE